MASNTAKFLRTAADLDAAIAALVVACPMMRTVHARRGAPLLRDYAADFSGLARIVVGQQLSAESAAAIWRRIAAVHDPLTADTVARLTDDEFRALGLSSGKTRTLRALAASIGEGLVNLEALPHLDDDGVRAALTGVHGIGPWTADIYLLFALKRADVFPGGDLALRLAVQRLKRRRTPLTERDVVTIAERWRPWRAAAALMLWADYSGEKARKPQRPAKRTENT
ncbi:MAG: DNA-3-methyladenine glycosylase family protein [Hyphomicrobium sp.]